VNDSFQLPAHSFQQIEARQTAVPNTKARGEPLTAFRSPLSSDTLLSTAQPAGGKRNAV
jgi:hypothetical protein